MTLAITLLILTPIISLVCAGITIDERYELTNRVAHTRLGMYVRDLVARHIDA